MSAGRPQEGAGCIAWWGFSPARDLTDAGPVRQKGDLNVLLVGSADPRHILKTIAGLQDGDNLHVWVIENCMEVVARQMLLLYLALTPQEDMGLDEKTEVFLELFGNTEIRGQTEEALKRAALQLSLSVTDTQETPTHPCLDTTKLKFKERDELSRIFQGWIRPPSSSSSSPGLCAPVAKANPWDCRVRQHLGTRYDSKTGSFNWDLTMKLHTKGCGLIDNQQYAKWRDRGIAFQMRDGAYDITNQSLLSSRLFYRKGGKVAVRGYWGDIVSSPYLSFGIETDDESLLKTQNGKHIKTAQDVSFASVQALFRSLACRRDAEKHTEKAEAGHKPASIDDLMRLRGISVTFLSMDSLIKMPEKPLFHHFFNSIYFSSSLVHRLGRTLKQIAAPDALLVVELAKFLLDLNRDQEGVFASKVGDVAREAGFVPCHEAKSDDAHAVFMLREESS
ncbi:dynein axonemal assembly factor 3 [Genypterus blacodes]|uniref:dynein axonemal assembly factor 3 n=1 Tax=Genypterus blacodes TaxID=154954 RepID=UPI003F7628DA